MNPAGGSVSKGLPEAGPLWRSFEVAPYWPQGEDEPMGTKDKQWLTFDDQSRWLFKFARSTEGVTRNEDWAEWVSWRVAVLLGVPAAVLVPATHEGSRGVLSRSVVPVGARLEHGNELLQKKVPGYMVGQPRHNPDYTVEVIRDALQDVLPPLFSSDFVGFTGFEVWTSYLILDAVVAGRDRHHANWGIIDVAGTRSLAPSFDHGNALGFQEQDHRVEALLSHPDRLQTWARRGKSHHFAGRPPLVSLAAQAIAMCTEKARAHWVRALQETSWEPLITSLESVPVDVMSEVRRTFVLSLVEMNRRRLVDELAS